MNSKLSRLVARWLASESGIAQALVTTLLLIAAPFVFHWSFTTAIFWYLAYCTFISYATQFTLAWQNKHARNADEIQLINQTEQMRLLVALAREIRGGQEEILEDLADALDPSPVGEAGSAD